MVGAKFLFKIHSRLCEIFNNSYDFGGVSMIIIGDFS